jgi:3-methyladenine DNA glycosylase AlkD
VSRFVEDVRRGLCEAADATKAPGMQAYMKSEMPFLGVQTPALRRVVRDALKAHPPDDWRAAVLELWRGAEFREERYAALALLRRHEREADLDLVEEIAVTGAWWDHVDAVAHVAGALLPGAAPAMRRWSHDDNLWKRRVAILCQLGRKDATDLVLLRDVLEPNLDDGKFFVRKAIGWALRDLAWTNPQWVDAYVRERTERLSPLSRREATKHLELLS